MNRRTVGLSLVTATGVGLVLSRRWSRSEGAHHPGLPGGADGDHEDWHLADYLHAASEHTADATQSLAHVVRSAQHAWQRRQAAGAGAASPGSAAEAASRPSSAVLLADFLTALNEGPAGKPPRRGIQLVNSQLADWLLERAAAAGADPQERRAILRYLSAILRNEEAAEALLQQPGAAPRLLALATQSFSLQQLLATAVAHASAPRMVPPADVAAVLALLAAEQQQRRARQHAGTAHQQQQLQLGLQLLLAWGRASALNAHRLAKAGAGPMLAKLAPPSATGGGMGRLQNVVAKLMGTLAQEAGKPQLLPMQGWLYHLFCFAADAAANSQWQLADTSLTSFATCLLRGCELPSQLMQRSTLPLLHKLAGQPDSPARPAIARVVQALAEGPGVQLPLEEREVWTETLLQWLVQLPGSAAAAAAAKQDGGSSGGGAGSGSGGGSRLRLETAGAGDAGRLQGRVTRALQALSAPAGSEGLHVAHAWLAELIVRLSDEVRPLPLEPDAAAAAAAQQPSSGGRWWWPWWGAAAGSAGSTEVAADGAVAAPMPAADGGEAAAAVAAAAAEGPYLPLAAPAAVGSAGDAQAAGGSGGSWWQGRWWPWGGGGGTASEQSDPQQAVKAAGKPSDSELALYINAAPVGPVYARSVAAALLEASGRVGSFQEPPASTEELMSPAEVAVYPQVAAAIDWDRADSAVCQALKVLCALASGGGRRRAWLLDSGILPLLHRLTLERPRDVAELASGAGEYVEAGTPLCIQRQAVRLLAMLASEVAGAGEVQEAGWIPWLQDLAVSTDLKLSSCASRALLHIESAAATQRPGLDLAQLAARGRLPHLHAAPAPLLPTEHQGAAAAAAAAAADAADMGVAADGADGPGGVGREEEARGVGTEAAEAAAEMLGEARLALAQARRRLDRQLDVVRAAVPDKERLVLQDGVHLFDPLAPHHEVLAREGIGADTSDAPLLDIVFVHGIRGGAFATWRREGVLEHGQARESLDRPACWPASWVAKELPEARLLSLEYAAPASGWEGESLPFRHIVAQLMDKLAAAGVGRRPVIFVCHRHAFHARLPCLPIATDCSASPRTMEPPPGLMGGLIVKDLLVTAKQQQDERLRSLNTSAVGAVFYSVPHAGSRLADWGWSLRYIGGSPAKHVQHLKTGHHQEELNAAVRAMCKSGRLPVLSFSEGLPTKLGLFPTQVVPHESAYPGYGDFVVLAQHDHISVCKPWDTSDPAYARLLAFLHARVRALRLARADAAGRLDHMEASVL
ncbi:hypothetical protein CHLNCDRAFT_136410 [Chlorella variabilis]|uniref:Uncharacterized protein n=1 Tax=Chlorella variabilis TaxID=554065 RepID=E1ZKA5_CHLVA|nr:hypothetical protein CHLNCDRAFT_136410 [Chlorella variabilis]EFN53770.1 hypothetical protein CHLNCDRAFT_136410 [Chlorella variabilis]|eukprot:XP_005845872.1 hypothetical protein CHLNCDRAFT_136410 [Chlorella variabilis]